VCRIARSHPRALALAPLLFVTIGMLSFPSVPASAAAALSITPITWNVVGLDSNNVNSGPNEFLSFARICNTGNAAATNVVANYVWDTANANINLSGSSTRSKSTLAAGACYDAHLRSCGDTDRRGVQHGEALPHHRHRRHARHSELADPARDPRREARVPEPQLLSSFLNWPGAIFEVPARDRLR